MSDKSKDTTDGGIRQTNTPTPDDIPHYRPGGQLHRALIDLPLLGHANGGNLLLCYDRFIVTHEEARKIIADLQRFYAENTEEELKAYNDELHRDMEAISLEGYVYLMSHPINGLHKIGMSVDPASRLYALRRQQKAKLEIVHTIKCEDMAMTELKMHQKFRPQCHHGEWFNLSPEHIEWFKSIKTDEEL